MSRSALKEALDLFELEEQESRKSSCSNNLKGQRQKSELVIDKMKRKPSKLELRKERLKSQAKLKKSVQDLSMKCILDEIKREKDVDHSKRNLEMLQYVSAVTSTSVSSDEVCKILDHNKGRLARDQRAEKNIANDEKETVFTDADFEEFERTYFCNS